MKTTVEEIYSAAQSARYSFLGSTGKEPETLVMHPSDFDLLAGAMLTDPIIQTEEVSVPKLAGMSVTLDKSLPRGSVQAMSSKTMHDFCVEKRTTIQTDLPKVSDITNSVAEGMAEIVLTVNEVKTKLLTGGEFHTEQTSTSLCPDWFREACKNIGKDEPPPTKDGMTISKEGWKALQRQWEKYSGTSIDNHLQIKNRCPFCTGTGMAYDFYKSDSSKGHNCTFCGGSGVWPYPDLTKSMFPGDNIRFENVDAQGDRPKNLHYALVNMVPGRRVHLSIIEMAEWATRLNLWVVCRQANGVGISMRPGMTKEEVIDVIEWQSKYSKTGEWNQPPPPAPSPDEGGPISPMRTKRRRRIE